ncbi:MAG: hypothetical protein AM326_08395 [Candidatus Thorarchaeota archaeon SMTZ-45]|nr:MAG: hypothetical protein AM325_00645 [Candidatus Thorarchaeota archaeon SMTZ1-45]KXH75885.1 MAG: hypothetical protein AM326_08395 [Candidatus Thorarchaeota archaeon SMTZ-45]
MNRGIKTALSVVAVVVIVFVFVWVLGLASLGSYAGAIGGMVGGVLGVTYLRRFHDERFTQIMNLAARNAFVFLVIILPMSSVVLIQVEEVTLQITAGLIFVPWIASLGILYLSLFYYYRK